MKTTKENEFFIWEEKNLTEQKMKLENSGIIVPNDITSEIKNVSVKSECEDTGKKKEWKKTCPKCEKEQFYSEQSSFIRAKKKNVLCNKCKNVGYILSNEQRNKISKSNRGKIRTDEMKKRYSECRLGSKLSEETKKKISEKQKGRKLSYKSRQKMSKSHIGIHCGEKRSDESKRLMRISKCERFQKLGIPSGKDKGSDDWFITYNKENKTNFQQDWYCKELGYYADGYDSDEHIWMEYDTPYHKQLLKKRKDKIRQNNIIRYFESIGNPLKRFVRIITWKNNKEKIIYEKKF